MDASVMLQEHREFLRVRAVAGEVADARCYFSLAKRLLTSETGQGA